MTPNTAWTPVFAGLLILAVVLGLGGYFYGRDGQRGDGNDIRIDLPGPKKNR